MLAKESKEAFENVREDIDRQEMRLEQLSSEQTADATTSKNKYKDIVLELAMLRQEVQAKDISAARSGVLDGLSRSQL